MDYLKIDTAKLRGLLWKRQLEVAKKAGMHPDTLQKKLKGEHQWTVRNINQIAKAGGFSVSEFMIFTEKVDIS